jgi:hypothetical protein
MNAAGEQSYQQRIAALEAENASLRQTNELLQSQRKEYLDIICGPVNVDDLLPEDQIAELIKNRIPAHIVLQDLDEILAPARAAG